MTDLRRKSCAACEGWVPPLGAAALAKLKDQIDPAWVIDPDGKSLSRRFTFKGYAKAVYTANLAAFLSDKEGHHADITFGWGYCCVTFSTHAQDRLTENDFICAAKLDAALV